MGKAYWQVVLGQDSLGLSVLRRPALHRAARPPKAHALALEVVTPSLRGCTVKLIVQRGRLQPGFRSGKAKRGAG
jgi:hypothetical protein